MHVVAKDTEEARDILANLFNSASRDEMDAMRYMLIEVCVCVFHGFSSTILSQDKDQEVVPKAVDLIPKQEPNQDHDRSPEQQQQQQPPPPQAEKVYRQSQLGREPLSVAGIGIEQVDEDFQYDEYSDDSHGDTSYSDSDFGTSQLEDNSNNDEQVCARLCYLRRKISNYICAILL